MLVTSIFYFSHNVFYPSKKNAFNLDQSKILLFGKEWKLPRMNMFPAVQSKMGPLRDFGIFKEVQSLKIESLQGLFGFVRIW